MLFSPVFEDPAGQWPGLSGTKAAEWILADSLPVRLGLQLHKFIWGPAMKGVYLRMAEKPKAVVLLSGGMDSCVTAAIANQTHRLALLHASYGQRTEKRERRAFDEIAGFYGVRERLVVRFDAFAQIGGSALTDGRIGVPESGEALAADAGIPTYVPSATPTSSRRR